MWQSIGMQAEIPEGWAIPTATDVAFAPAVLAEISSNLPTSLRMFLLALVVLADLISTIAVFYPGLMSYRFPVLAVLPQSLSRGWFRNESALGTSYSHSYSRPRLRFKHSTCFVGPAIAFFSACLSMGGVAGLTTAFIDSVALSIVGAMILGKFMGALAPHSPLLGPPRPSSTMDFPRST